jgi:transcription-repair coupling factor (superfamily II helicase)
MRRLTKLGSGFNLALEDLEIRGAGNLFGTKQSGKIYDVGIEFYLELLEQEINRVKDNETENLLSPEVIANQDVFIPQSYISSAEKRLFYYKKISLIQHKDDCLEIIEELLDKFGPIPKELLNLIYIAEIKINMKRLGISKLKIKSKSLIIRALKLGKIKNIETEFINLNLELQNIAKLTRKIKNLEDIIKTNYEFRDDKIIIDSATIL